MVVAKRFAVSIHILVFVELYKGEAPVTSEMLARSVGINPVCIRRILGALKKAGLVGVVAGKGGTYLLRELADISLYDVYAAVYDNADADFFAIHDSANPACPVGNTIGGELEDVFGGIQSALQGYLRAVKVQQIAHDLRQRWADAGAAPAAGAMPQPAAPIASGSENGYNQV